MTHIIFGLPLNLGIGTWVVISISSIAFMVMFGLSSALGDYQGLVKTTLDNDSRSRKARENNKKTYK
tara:strand:+ start:68 stop:268 length:201 start_codon:yes stop_codon:yes gene_type:complete